ncbi:MAG: VCBS repeat-containing protein [Bacteroidota bacterium]
MTQNISILIISILVFSSCKKTNPVTQVEHQTIYETSTKNHEWNNGFESSLLSSFNNPYKPMFISGYTYFDYNNDGIFDIFGRDDNSPDGIHRLHVCVNDGKNNWTEIPNVIETQTFNLYRKIVSADIDNDGDLDFVGFIAEDANSNIVNPHNQPAGGIDIFRNEKGIFKLEHVVPLTVGNDFFFHTGVLADINHDGWIDIVAGGGPIKVFLNDGTGHFKNQSFEAGFKTGSGEFDFHGETGVFELEAADVNNDGYVDLLAGFARNLTSYPNWHSDLSNYSLTAQIYYGKGSYPFINDVSTVLPTNYNSKNATPQTLINLFDCTMDFAISDLNNDGYLDILTWSLNADGPSGNSAIELYENNKDGTFKNITSSFFDKGDNEFLGVGNWFKIWDIDKDGVKEILFEVTPDIGNGNTNNFNGWKNTNGKFKKTILHPVY